MEKKMEEEELKGLEEEIDDAVNRLFVEKKGGMVESFLMESPSPEPPVKTPVIEPIIKSPAIEPFMKPPIAEPSIKPPIVEPPMKSLLLEPLIESSLSESSDEMEKIFDLESASPPPPVPTPFLKSIEKMEVQLPS